MTYTESTNISDAFKTSLDDWQKQLSKYETQETDVRSRLETWTTYQQAYQTWYTQPRQWVWNGLIPAYQQPGEVPRSPDITGMKAKYYVVPGYKEAMAKVKTEVTKLNDELLKTMLYESLYSEVPYAIQSGAVNSADDVLSKLPTAQLELLSDVEEAEFRSTIESMFAAVSGNRATTAEGVAEVVDETTPDIVAPKFGTANRELKSVQNLTVNEILKYLNVAKMPPQVMTDEEWQKYLEISNAEEPADQQALDLVAQWKERDNQIQAYKDSIAEMPDYKFTDFLNELWQSPALAIGEMADIYFEHVTRPLSGLVYSKAKKPTIAGHLVSSIFPPAGVITAFTGNEALYPDIQKAYEEFRKTESTWMAYGDAWEDWDNNMWLKMLMETPLDPTTYIGWGVLSKVAKPIPYVGRFVGAAERGFASAMDLPFDLIKAASMKLPQTITQKAMRVQSLAAQTVKKYMEQEFKTTFRGITRENWASKAEKIITEAVEFAQKHPYSEVQKALFGKQLLMHSPIGEEELATLAKAVGSKLTPKEVTRVTLENINNIFEDMFTYKILQPKEAASKILTILDGATDDATLLKVQNFLTDKSDTIVNKALAVSKAKSVTEAMESLSRRNFQIYIDTAESTAAVARQHAGTFSTLLTKVSTPLQSVWRNQIDRLVVRPFAEAYLAFAMYGPMNVVEDYIRSALGRVQPGSMGRDEFDVIAYGLSTDPMFQEAKGISETGGQVFKRLGGDEDWNNWILQLGGLAKNWGDKVYTALVRLPGAYSMDVRRNFVARKYMQLLKEKGGDALQQLAKAGPTAPPKLSDAKLARQVYEMVGKAKLTGDYKTIQTVADMFTRKKIVGREVREVLMQHPELPNSARDNILKWWNDDKLFAEVGNIQSAVDESYNIVLDDFIRGPERASEGFRKLADELTALEVKSPDDLAQLLQSVQYMSQMYGATPRQVMAQATIRSRGLPIAERFATINADMERIATYLEKSGADIQRVVEKIKASSSTIPVQPEYIRNISWSGFTDTERGQMVEWLNKLPPGAKPRLKKVSLSNNLGDLLGDYSPDDGEIFLRKEHLNEQTFYHEVAHSIIADDVEKGNFDTIQRFSEKFNVKGESFSGYSTSYEGLEDLNKVFQRIKEEHPDIDDALAEAYMYNENEGYHNYMEALSDGFSDWMSGKQTRYADFFTEVFGTPGQQSIISQQYSDSIQQLMDALTAKRELLSNFRMQNMEWRRQFFAGKKSGREINWNQFYTTNDNMYNVLDLDVARLDGQIASLTRKIDESNGITKVTVPFIKITDRPIAANDIARLLGVRGDDISRGLLDSMCAQNNKAHFIEYVKSFVRDGDVGFTDESIGRVYDEIFSGLGIDPSKASWVTKQQMELEAVRKDLHNLYNAKLVPEADTLAIKKYVDDTANAVRDVVSPKKAFSKDVQQWLNTPTDQIVRTPDEVYDIARKAGLADEDIFGTQQNIVKATQPAVETMEMPLETQERLLNMPGEDASRPGISDWQGGIVYRDDVGKPVGVIVFDPDGNIGSRVISRDAPTETRRAASRALWDEIDKRGLKPTEQGLRSRESLESWERHEAAKAGKPAGKLPLTTDELKQIVKANAPRGRAINTTMANYQTIRQQAMDEAHKWYYKEFVDYTHANVFDSAMKTIYPYWTYESQRWFWLPRSFMQHPGVFTSLERYKDNTDNGYVHVPGTSIEINPFRGTIYGAWVGRLSKRDYPEYYDKLGAFSYMNDLMQRYGFFPGAHISIPFALFGGSTPQMGETLPAIWKTPLDLTYAAFPDFAPVKTLVEHIFPDKFRDYLTITEATTRGGDGLAIWTKMQNKEPLTPEEQAMWDASKRETSLYSALFEQTGMMRLKSEEQIAVSKASAAIIEQMTGYTEEQQDWLQKHGYRLWDLIGGMSPTQQAQLKELDLYRWQGLSRPLLPSQQQEVLNRLDSDWSDIENYVMGLRSDKLTIEKQFLAGEIGPTEYNDGLTGIYNQQREYIEAKQAENPILTLEGRKEYYKKYGITEPVQHPMRELLNLYFSVELKQIKDENGQLVYDWDTFWQQRNALESAIPDNLKAEWEGYMSRNSTPMERLRQAITRDYFKEYNGLWDAAITRYTPEEQRSYKEYKYLVTTGRDITRQQELRNIVTANGKKLVSSIESDVSNAREALRYANPFLDAWLVYWGRTTSFKTQQARDIYQQLLADTGRAR